MKRYAYYPAIFAALLALAGCDALKGPEIDLAADRTTISAGGHEYAEITATVQTKGKPAAGVEVEFETEYGDFDSPGSGETSKAVATDSDGIATIRLYSSVEQGQTQVSAFYSDDESGQDAEAHITIVFGPPQAGNLPVDGQFHLNCLNANLGALRGSNPSIQVPCNLTAQTALGDQLSIESMNVSFLAEAGSLTTVLDEDFNVVYSVQGGNSAPEDVPPLNGEPSRVGSLGQEYNPRDGVVTLVAMTRGSEAFTDVNGNGVRDSNEPYEPSVEPFLDVNDNGVHDPGETYYDTNGDGEWTGDNGQYDEDTYIWTWTKVLWTGDLEEATDAARLETDPVSTVLADGGQMTLSVWLLDRHMNPIASYLDAYDYIELSDSSSNLEFTPDYTVSLSEQFPMSFDADGKALEWYINNGCEQVAGCYQITVYDGSPGYVEDPALDYILSVTLYTTPGPQLTDWAEQQQSWFVQNITGTTE